MRERSQEKKTGNGKIRALGGAGWAFLWLSAARPAADPATSADQVFPCAATASGNAGMVLKGGVAGRMAPPSRWIAGKIAGMLSPPARLAKRPFLRRSFSVSLVLPDPAHDRAAPRPNLAATARKRPEGLRVAGGGGEKMGWDQGRRAVPGAMDSEHDVAERIQQYLREGRRQEALALFEEHPTVHASLPITTFKGLLQAGNDLRQGDRTLRVWEALHTTPLRPDRICFSQHIKALGLLKRPKEARAALEAMRLSVPPDAWCYAACVSALCGTAFSP